MKHKELNKYFLQKWYDKEFGFGACGVCSLSKLLSEMFDIDLLPTALNQLLINNNGYQDENLIKWNSIKNFLDVSVQTILWTKYRKIHTDLNLIHPPCIVSMDGNRIESGYQSHFVYLRNWIYKYEYGKRPNGAETTPQIKEIVNGHIFCPINGELLIVPHFGLDLKNSIFSVINIRKV